MSQSIFAAEPLLRLFNKPTSSRQFAVAQHFATSAQRLVEMLPPSRTRKFALVCLFVAREAMLRAVK